MKLNSLSLKSSEFDSLSPHVKTVLIQIGIAINEIGYLKKLIIYCENDKKKSELRSSTEVFMVDFHLLVLIGKIKEYWWFIQQQVLKNQEFLELFKNGSEILNRTKKELNRYFGRKNPIDLIRNDFAFHFNYDDIKTALKEDELGVDFQFYFGDNTANDFFPISYEVLRSVTRLRLKRDQKMNLEELDREIVKTASTVMDFSRALFMNIIEHFDLGLEAQNEIKLEDAPSVNEPQIPFFTRFEQDT